VPEISRFFGIVVAMFYNDHAPPHFHVRYGQQKATVEIASLEILEGQLSRRVVGLVKEWGKLHQAELATDWELARIHSPLNKIEPLD
jgi:hypothetical protein